MAVLLIDPSNELKKEAFEGCDITFTDSLDVLREARFFIVAVPTPVDAHNVPDLTPVTKASQTIGKVLKKGDYVVFESTVYPGCTEEDFLRSMEGNICRCTGYNKIFEAIRAAYQEFTGCTVNS